MESGVIATVDGPRSLEEFHDSVPLDNDAPFAESERCIEIRSELTLESGKPIYQGRAAIEELSEQEVSEISSDGTVSSSTTVNKETKYTEFLFVPDSFIAVENSAGTFLFQLLNVKTDHSVTPTNIDLNGYLLDHDDALVWKLGFKDRGANAENGVLHGHDLLEDQEVGGVLGQTEKNQIGIEHSFDSESVKVFLTESGYIDVYQPSSYDSKEFVNYILDEVIDFTVSK
ncbi:hypothetical protein NP511_09240 [Natrinema thermotolerans]|uniref:Uncharacterized protein n=1 Tax=Natrinema thermotolerans TaxID=121872 RepID=A0AAF0T0P2_9EURY|nr:hypothetical protein [Natrinema thermotolerans]WMT09796.1 hypothetical protein NP511_09240 [Natrinema thermotolerans]